MADRAPVKFDHPPVVEVACGVAFALPNPLKTLDIASYWERIRAEYPNADDQPPMPFSVERIGNVQTFEFGLEAMNLPPLRRVWFVNAVGNRLIQLQGDRLLYNWKSTEGDKSYPSYGKVIQGFREQWDSFAKFAEQRGLGNPDVKQLELTYVNIVPDDAASAVLIDHTRRETGSRFLPPPEAFQWRTQYLLPDSLGRLHVNATAVRTVKGEKALRLDITARGIPVVVTSESVAHWFDVGHEWITQGFADITDPEIQKNLWRRTA